MQIGRLHPRCLADEMMIDRLACDPGNAGEHRASACSWRRSLSAVGSGDPGPLAIVASFVSLRNKPTNTLVGDNGRPFSLARQQARRLLSCVDRAASNHTGQTDDHGSQRTAAPAGQAGAQTGRSITGRRSTSSTDASLRPRVAVDDASGRGSIPGCDTPHTLAGVSGRQRDPGWWCEGSAAGASQ